MLYNPSDMSISLNDRNSAVKSFVGICDVENVLENVVIVRTVGVAGGLYRISFSVLRCEVNLADGSDVITCLGQHAWKQARVVRSHATHQAASQRSVEGKQPLSRLAQQDHELQTTASAKVHLFPLSVQFSPVPVA